MKALIERWGGVEGGGDPTRRYSVLIERWGGWPGVPDQTLLSTLVLPVELARGDADLTC